MGSLYEAWNRGRANGAERAKQSQLAELMGPAMQGDAAAQSKLFGVDQQAGMQAQQFTNTQRKQAEDRAAKLSSVFAQTRDPVIYTQWRQAAQGLLGPSAAGMPETLDDPNDLDGAVKTATAWAQAYGGGGQQPEQFTLAPGSTRYDASGRVIAVQPFTPAKDNWQVENVPDGQGGTRQMERNPATGEWRNPRYGGGPQPQPSPSVGAGGDQGGSFGIPETDNYVKRILSNVGQLDPNASPEQLAAQLLPHLIQQESGGNPNAISPKGAQGLTQVMPTTGQDPGFGVRPMQSRDPEENVRFGRDYLTAMLRRYPGRPDLALAAYNAGPGVADRFANGQPSGGRLGYTPPKTAETNAVRTLRPDELAGYGLTPGTVAQVDNTGKLFVVSKPDKADASNGLNDRQRVAVQGVQRNLIQYAAALTGKTPEELRALSSDEIAQLVQDNGGRFLQGGVARFARNLPGGQTIAEVSNSDILSYSQGAGASWAAYENPTGIITNSDRETATAQMPNLYDPPQVQAAKIKNFLELSGWGGQQAQQQPTQQQPSAAGSRQGQQSNSVPPQAIEYLRKNPAMRQQFEQKYGVSADAYLR